jgi:hypothetical protein
MLKNMTTDTKVWPAPAPMRRSLWRTLAVLVAGFTLGIEAVFVGILMPLLRPTNGSSLTVTNLTITGLPEGLDVAGVLFPWPLAAVVFVPLGVLTLAAIVGALRGSALPLLLAAALWLAVAVVTSVVSGGAAAFKATQLWLFIIALVAAWPDVRIAVRRRWPVPPGEDIPALTEPLAKVSLAWGLLLALGALIAVIGVIAWGLLGR